MSATHTPGPWSAAAHIVYSGPHHRVATVQAVGAQAEADAALIASAPDLLATLIRINTLQHGGREGNKLLVQEMRYLARNAIARATGAA